MEEYKHRHIHTHTHTHTQQQEQQQNKNIVLLNVPDFIPNLKPNVNLNFDQYFLPYLNQSNANLI